MLNRSKLVATAIAFAAVTVSAPAFAGSSWLDEQRGISDGYSANDKSAGVEGKQGSQAFMSQLDDKLFMSDGYSHPNEFAGNVYIGAKIETVHDDFVQRGLRVSDGATE